MLAMASNSHNDRLQARRNRAQATASGPNIETQTDDESLFPVPAVRVKRENDDISNRIKGLFYPPHHISSSPSQGVTKVHAQNKPTNQQRDPSGKPPNPMAPQPTSDKDKHNSKSGRESKKKGESSEHKHKHKERDKEKKKKSSHSEERHSKKKSKSADKSHSEVKDLAATTPIPKKIKHRSSSVSSDRSDLSVRSRSSTDKQQYTNIKNIHEHSSKTTGSKSKHSFSGSSASQSTTLHDQSLTSQHTSSGLTSTTPGASNSNKGATNKYSSLTSSVSDHSTNVVSSDSRIHSGSKVREKDDRPMNGLVRPGAKPTNLVIPSINPSQTASHKNDKEDLAVKKILAEMMIKPTERITEIQTPCKVDTTSPYQFLNINKLIEPLSNERTTNKEGKLKAPISITKEISVKPNASKPTLTIKTKQPNGVVDDLQLSPSVADSDSGSSSSSNSSDSSSSSSSSGSDSDSSDEDGADKSVPPMRLKLERSPLPAASTESSSNIWDLSTYYESKPAQTDVKKAEPKPSGISAASKAGSGSHTGLSKGTDGITKEKRKRGRPRKEEAPKRNPDPDFTPPLTGKHLPISIPPSTVTTDRQKRLSSSSKPKPDVSKGATKRGRPPRKKTDNDRLPSAVSTDQAIISTTLSVDRSSSKNPSSLGETRPSSSTSKPPVPAISSSSSVGEEDVDVDVDVDVVSDKSPSVNDSVFTAGKISLPTKIKSEPATSVPTPLDRLLAKHEPISPAEVKTEPFSHFTPIGSSHMTSNGVMSLIVRIPLKQLQRPPSIKPIGLEASIVDIPSLPGIKEEKLSPPPPYKRKSTTPPNSFQQAMQDAKKRKPMTEEEPMSLELTDHSTDYGPGGKGGHKLGTIPPYTGSHLYYTQARELKSRSLSMASSTNAKPLKYLLAVESVVTFMMSGIGREAEDPKAIQSIKPYYSSTLGYAETTFGDCLALKESNSTQPQIHKCTQVLCHFVLGHLKHKCYKLLKDQASSCGKHVEEFLYREKNKQSISPHTHAGLPPGNSPAAPSPASITSTGSLTSDSGRGASLPPGACSSVVISDSLLKDVGEYMKCMNFLSASTDQWKTAQFWRSQTYQKEFFDQLDKDIEYTIDILTESRPFVHYVHTACLRLKKDLDVATSYSSSYS